MRSHAGTLLSLSVAALAVAGAPTVVAAKCTNATVPGVALILDDRVVGTFDNAADGFGDVDSPSPEEIHSVTVGCRTLPDGGRQAMVLVTTKTGHSSVVELHLRELVDRQRDWYASSGRYRDVTEINFYGSTTGVPIETVTTDAGWSATARLTELGMTCHVVVGEAESPHPELATGEPTCFTEAAGSH